MKKRLMVYSLVLLLLYPFLDLNAWQVDRSSFLYVIYSCFDWGYGQRFPLTIGFSGQWESLTITCLDI